MISVLICSVRPQLLEQVKKNIDDTIGVPYELISFDNRSTGLGLCEVYNNLAKRAPSDLLCFVHEDVQFETKDWGKLLVEIFNSNNDVGVVGLAGSKYKSAMYSGWFTGIKEFDCANVLHEYPGGEETIYLNPDTQALHDVACVDGVFIACRKSIWQQVEFDAENLKGFHAYDLDFSLRASKISRIVVTFNILLRHITGGGDFSDAWMEETIKLHQKMKGQLPMSVKNKAVKNAEIEIAKNTLDVLKNFSIQGPNKIRWVMKQNLYKHPTLWYGISKFFLYRPLRLRYIHNFFK